MNGFYSHINGKLKTYEDYYVDCRIDVKESLHELNLSQKIIYLTNTLQNYTNKQQKINPEEETPLRLFIDFLNDKLRLYTFIELNNFDQSIWLEDFALFKSLFRELKRQGVITTTFEDFKSFFILKNSLKFNLNIYNTVYLFETLRLNGCISQLTIENLINNFLVVCKHGKRNEQTANHSTQLKDQILTLQGYITSKKKITNIDTYIYKSEELTQILKIFKKQIPE